MIAKGMLGNKRYEAIELSINHIPQLHILQKEVVAALPNPEILQPLDEEELHFILNGNGKMIGIFVKEQLIAFRALLQPEIDDEHLGKDIGVAEKDLHRVLYQEISNVHPNYRGYGLQQTMAKYVMALVDPNEHPIICATVMPYNIASLKDKFAQQMYVAALKLKYGGKLRYVFVKNLMQQPQFEKEAIEISMSETEKQQALLKQGYVGVSMRALADDWLVTYKKIIE